MSESQSAENSQLSDEEVHSLETIKTATGKIRSELGKVIVGQADVIDQLVMAIYSQGHCLLEGVPGLAKTLMVSTLAKSMKLDFSRVQFTPDLMPSDITGTEVIQEDKASDTPCRGHSLSWRRRTRSSRRVPTRCLKPSKTGSCSKSSSIIRIMRKSIASPT